MNAFTEAFALGSQVGARIRERRADNALAAYVSAMPQGGIVATPDQQQASQQAYANLAKYNPQMAVQVRRYEQEGATSAARAQAELAKRRQEGLPQVINLLKGSTDQATYQQNVATARSLGIDTSNLPAQFDPAWRDQQIATLERFATPQGQEAMSTVGKEATDAGYRPGTPEYVQFVRQRLASSDLKTIPLQPGGSVAQYDPATGQARIVIAPNNGQMATGSAVGGGPQVGAVVGGYRFKGGNPNDRNNWEQAGGGSGNATGNFR